MQAEPFLQLVHRGSSVTQTPDGIYHVYKHQRIAHRAKRLKSLEQTLGAGTLAFIGLDDHTQADVDVLVYHNETWYMVLTMYNRRKEELVFTAYDMSEKAGMMRYDANDLHWVKEKIATYLANLNPYRLSFVTGTVKWMDD